MENEIMKKCRKIIGICLLSLFCTVCLTSCITDGYLANSILVPPYEIAEQNMQNKLLRCKDVESVIVKIPDCFDEVKADVYVYLTNGRYLEFSCVDYKMKNPKMWFFRIGDFIPWIYYYQYEEINGRFAILADINRFFPKVKSVQDIINNYDEIYEFVFELNEYSDKMDLLSDWSELASDVLYIEGAGQYKLFKRTPKTNKYVPDSK